MAPPSVDVGDHFIYGDAAANSQQHASTGSSFCLNVKDIFRMWRSKFLVSSSQTGKTSNRMWFKKFSSVLKHERHLYILRLKGPLVGEECE